MDLAVPIPIPVPIYGGYGLEKGSGAWWAVLIGNGLICVGALALVVWMVWAVRSLKRDARRRAELAGAQRDARAPFLALAEQLEGPGWNVSEGFETGIREAADLIRKAAAGQPLREPPVPPEQEGYLMEQRCPRCLTLTEEQLRIEDERREQFGA